MNSKQKKLLIILLVVLLLVGTSTIIILKTGIFDACKNKLEDCNYACGEGILASICKEKCAYDYRTCEKS